MVAAPQVSPTNLFSATAASSRTAGLGSSEMLPRGPNGRFPEAAPQRPSGQRMSVQGRLRRPLMPPKWLTRCDAACPLGAQLNRCCASHEGQLFELTMSCLPAKACLTLPCPERARFASSAVNLPQASTTRCSSLGNVVFKSPRL
jgi:hypothetical protein